MPDRIDNNLSGHRIRSDQRAVKHRVSKVERNVNFNALMTIAVANKQARRIGKAHTCGTIPNLLPLSVEQTERFKRRIGEWHKIDARSHHVQRL